MENAGNNKIDSMKMVIIGLLGATAVALGALGAHALKNQVAGGKITLDQLNGFDTGARYQIYHTLAMFLVILLQQHFPHKFLRWAYNCFLTGIILFSGSLYLLCTRGLTGIDGLRVLGPITPIGGLFFIAGWLLILLPFIKKR